MRKFRHVFCMVLVCCMVLSLLPVMGHATRERHIWSPVREEVYRDGTLIEYTDNKFDKEGMPTESRTMELDDNGKFVEVSYIKHTFNDDGSSKIEGRVDGSEFTEVTTYESSEKQHVSTTIRTPGNIKRVETTTLDENGNPVRSTFTVNGKLESESVYQYDQQGRQIASKHISYHSDGSVSQTYGYVSAYDDYGQEYWFMSDDMDHTKIKLTQKKDANGNVTEVNAVLGSESKTVYYDASGNPTKMVEKDDSGTTTATYKNGRVDTEVSEWAWGETYTTKYEYDANGNTTKVTNKYSDGTEYVRVTKYAETVIPAEQTFQDVPMSEYYFNPVEWAVEYGITDGTSDTTFSPNATCTRGQIVTFLWRAMGEPEPTNKNNPFTDVKPDDYFYTAVLWAKEAGITDGTTDTTFSPNASCTRGHAVTFLWRAEGKPAMNANNPFKDVPAGQYYTEAVLWALSQKITDGTSDTTFSPDTACTRGQIVTFLYRDLEESL